MRILTLPAGAVSVVLAVAFFKVYGVLTRPDVPMPVAVVVGQFAPGVEIGARVYDARRAVAGMTYVPHLGYVGIPGDRPANLPGGGKVSFTQVRLLVDERTRSQPAPDTKKARIEAVEIVSTEGYAPSEISNALRYLFRREPRIGCVTTSGDGSYRDVQLWLTPNERGGVALISDNVSADAAYPGLNITNVLAFTGKFAGSETLRANYTATPCASLAGAQ